MNHMSDDCVFIRPTGNPDKEDDKMMNDAVSVELRTISINKLHVCGDMAWVCYTNHGKFNYMGNANDDVAVLTAVLES